MTYLLYFVIFLLVMQFAFAFLPYLLPIFLIVWLISLFRKPNVHIYTQNYSYENRGAGSAGRTVSRPTLPARKPLEGSIDAEFTEVHEAGE